MTLARDVHLGRLLGAGPAAARRDLEGVRVYTADQTALLDRAGARPARVPARDAGRPAVRRARSGCAARRSPTAIARDRAAGLTPFAIAAVAGSTNTGSVDLVGELADVAAAEDLWLHVDAAYGGARPAVGARCATAWPTSTGPTRSRSIRTSGSSRPTTSAGCWSATGAHLAVGVRRSGARVLPRRRDAGRRRRRPTTPTTTTTATSSTSTSSSFEGTRRWRALKLWMSWKHLGTDGFGRLIEANDDLAAHLARRCAESDDFEALPAEPGAVGRLLPAPARRPRRPLARCRRRARRPPGRAPGRARGVRRRLADDDAAARRDLAARRDRQLPRDRGRHRPPARDPAAPRARASPRPARRACCPGRQRVCRSIPTCSRSFHATSASPRTNARKSVSIMTRTAHVGRRRDGRRPDPVADQGDLAEVAARARAWRPRLPSTVTVASPSATTKKPIPCSSPWRMITVPAGMVALLEVAGQPLALLAGRARTAAARWPGGPRWIRHVRGSSLCSARVATLTIVLCSDTMPWRGSSPHADPCSRYHSPTTGRNHGRPSYGAGTSGNLSRVRAGASPPASHSPTCVPMCVISATPVPQQPDGVRDAVLRPPGVRHPVEGEADVAAPGVLDPVAGQLRVDLQEALVQDRAPSGRSRSAGSWPARRRPSAGPPTRASSTGSSSCRRTRGPSARARGPGPRAAARWR